MTQVRTKMTQRVGYAMETDRVDETYQSMCSMGIRHVPVLRDGQLVGMVSDRDVLLHAEPNDAGAPKIPPLRLTEIMSRNVVTCRESDSIPHCIDVMLREHIDCLPVLSDEGRLAGLITTTDLLRLLRESDPPAEKRLPFRWEILPLAAQWKSWLGLAR